MTGPLVMVADAPVPETPAGVRRRARIRAITLESRAPDRAATWYRQALGLSDAEPLLTAGGVELRFTLGTSDAPNTLEPARIILNFHIADIRTAEARLVALEAVWVRELERTRWGIIGTVLDLDGNYVQIVEPAPDSPPCLQRKEEHP
ncbi:MAG TPA: VOC family protein [Acidimicrobiia bacterium]|nr:VOC family protein [Acidimicrobiia bacterium]